jgi:threonine dehydrogenase-like Zn-dependent dehydrogenase
MKASPESDGSSGYMIDGTQAEFVRVPFAENSVYKIPTDMSDAEGILLSDILPTGFEIGVQYGQVQPGDVVAVIGSGPVGLFGRHDVATLRTVQGDCHRPRQRSPQARRRIRSHRHGELG